LREQLARLLHLLFVVNGRHIGALVCLILVALAAGRSSAEAQARDSLLNGGLIGAAAGAAVGVAYGHAVRDSDLTFGQYARGSIIFGAFGAGIGVGIDALLQRSPSPQPVASPRISIAPALWRGVTSVTVNCSW
jgi:hypothetical protein